MVKTSKARKAKSGPARRSPAGDKAAKEPDASALLARSMAKDTTSNRDAAAAAKVLKDPRASKKDKTLAASALVQWPVTKPRRTSRDKIIEAVLARKREKERAL